MGFAIYEAHNSRGTPTVLSTSATLNVVGEKQLGPHHPLLTVESPWVHTVYVLLSGTMMWGAGFVVRLRDEATAGLGQNLRAGISC